MDRWPKLHKRLCEVAFPGVPVEEANVYFNPPNNFIMKYPCVRFARSKYFEKSSNNKTYIGKMCYLVTVISRSPDTDITYRIKNEIPYCSYDRSYVADNLHHDVFEIYY